MSAAVSFSEQQRQDTWGSWVSEGQVEAIFAQSECPAPPHGKPRVEVGALVLVSNRLRAFRPGVSSRLHCVTSLGVWTWAGSSTAR